MSTSQSLATDRQLEAGRPGSPLNGGRTQPRKERIISRTVAATIMALQILLMTLIVAATIVLYVIFASNLLSQTARIDSVSDLLPVMQRSFAGVLTVVLGLELLETLQTYFTEHHIRLEVILVVAIIAVSRHLIQVDFEHTQGSVLFGLAAVVLALTCSYFLLKKTQLATSGGKDGPKSQTDSS